MAAVGGSGCYSQICSAISVVAAVRVVVGVVDLAAASVAGAVVLVVVVLVADSAVLVEVVAASVAAVRAAVGRIMTQRERRCEFSSAFQRRDAS